MDFIWNARYEIFYKSQLCFLLDLISIPGIQYYFHEKMFCFFIKFCSIKPNQLIATIENN